MAVLQVKRQEIKYQISLLEYKKLERNLKACMRQDEYAAHTASEVCILTPLWKKTEWTY